MFPVPANPMNVEWFTSFSAIKKRFTRGFQHPIKLPGHRYAVYRSREALVNDWVDIYRNTSDLPQVSEIIVEDTPARLYLMFEAEQNAEAFLNVLRIVEDALVTLGVPMEIARDTLHFHNTTNNLFWVVYPNVVFRNNHELMKTFVNDLPVRRDIYNKNQDVPLMLSNHWVSLNVGEHAEGAVDEGSAVARFEQILSTHRDDNDAGVDYHWFHETLVTHDIHRTDHNKFSMVIEKEIQTRFPATQNKRKRKRTTQTMLKF
jgi:hypothetical protein